ncbi:hypothetical protein [Rhodocaloribacter sp.]
MAEPLYLLYLDRVHQSDPLFRQGLARALASAGARLPRCILLHGSGDRLARMFEAQGLVYGAPGVHVPPALVERAMREETRRIVGVLTDAGVAAVGFQGTDRRMLRPSDGGGVVARGAAWVRDLTDRRVVPVVSSLVRDAGGEAREAATAEVASAFAKALETEEVYTVFFTPTNRPGLIEGGAVRATIRAADLPASGASYEPEAVRRVVAAGGLAWLTSPVGFIDEGGPQGTRVIS